jgi:hypothetical protein
MAKRYQKGNQQSLSRKDRKYNGHKIPKGISEVVNRGRTDKTMVTRYQKGNQKS